MMQMWCRGTNHHKMVRKEGGLHGLGRGLFFLLCHDQTDTNTKLDVLSFPNHLVLEY